MSSSFARSRYSLVYRILSAAFDIICAAALLGPNYKPLLITNDQISFTLSKVSSSLAAVFVTSGQLSLAMAGLPGAGSSILVVVEGETESRSTEYRLKTLDQVYEAGKSGQVPEEGAKEAKDSDVFANAIVPDGSKVARREMVCKTVTLTLFLSR